MIELLLAMGFTAETATTMTNVYQVMSLFHLGLFVGELLGGPYWVGTPSELRTVLEFTWPQLERMLLCFVLFVEELDPSGHEQTTHEQSQAFIRRHNLVNNQGPNQAFLTMLAQRKEAMLVEWRATREHPTEGNPLTCLLMNTRRLHEETEDEKVLRSNYMEKFMEYTEQSSEADSLMAQRIWLYAMLFRALAGTTI